MSTLANYAFFPVQKPQNQFASGSSLSVMQADQCLGSTNLFIGPGGTTKLHRKPLTVRAGRDGSSPGGAIFTGGFVLGGIVFGTLAAIYAPEISEALAKADSKGWMRKLPKFMYDKKKALENSRKKLTAKIAQLNSAIDEITAQLLADEVPNGSPAAADEVPPGAEDEVSAATDGFQTSS